MAQPDRSQLEIAGLSDTGRRRSNNEDTIWWSEGHAEAATPEALLVVADGMGGAAAGEVASQAAVAEFRDVFVAGAGEPDMAERLTQAVARANAQVYGMAQDNDQYEGMGTTFTAAAITSGQLFVGHVGDSRCYLIRDGQCSQITSDHTWVAEEVQSGRLDEEAAAQHPARKAISRGVGIDRDIVVDLIGPIELDDADVVLLCSDGLSDVVRDEEIAKATSSTSPAQAIRSLVRLANSRGGPDNVSIVAARLPGQRATALAGAAVRRRPSNFGGRTASAPTRALPLRLILVAPVAFVALVGGVLGVLSLTGGDSDQSPGLVVHPTEEAPTTRTPQATSGRPSPTSSRPRVTPSPARGRVTGLAQCDDDSPGFTYVVADGETLSDIANRYDWSSSEVAACDGSIENPDAIGPGQEIRIPCPVDGCPEVQEEP